MRSRGCPAFGASGCVGHRNGLDEAGLARCEALCMSWDDRNVRISLLPTAPVFAGVLGQVKRNRIGDDRIVRISPLPRAPVFAGILGHVKRNRIGYDRIVGISPLPRAPVLAGYSGG